MICFNSNNVLKNSEYGQRFISGDEIIDYAVELLNITDDPKIISLSILKTNEQEEILNSLQQLSKDENCDYSLEFRKFRAMYLYENLPNESVDFMHGILKISEIWDQFNFPNDSPNIYFEFEAYSLKNFKKLLEINNNWVFKEFGNLKSE